MHRTLRDAFARLFRDIVVAPATDGAHFPKPRRPERKPPAVVDSTDAHRLRQLEHENATLRAESHQFKDELLRAIADRDKAQRECERLRESEQLAKTLKAEVEKLKHELEIANRQLEDLPRQREEIHYLHQAVENSNKALIGWEQLAREKTEVSEKAINDLAKARKEQAEDNAKARARINSLEADVARLASELDAANEERAKLGADVQQCRAENAKLEAAVEQLTACMLCRLCGPRAQRVYVGVVFVCMCVCVRACVCVPYVGTYVCTYVRTYLCM
jgi:DNA repair exonuclease SbcCD ATPase subunit